MACKAIQSTLPMFCNNFAHFLCSMQLQDMPRAMLQQCRPCSSSLLHLLLPRLVLREQLWKPRCQHWNRSCPERYVHQHARLPGKQPALSFP